MFSLRNQLFAALLIAFAGGAAAMYYGGASLWTAAAVALLSLALAATVLYFFVLTPMRKIRSAVARSSDPDLPTRAVVHSSAEFESLSDAINDLLRSFRADIETMKKLQRVRSEFLGNVTHELRTPIFSTQGLIETLLNGAIDDPAVNREFLQRALVNTERLNTLLSDLIDITRIESGELKLRFRIFEIGPLISTVVDEMQQNAAPRNIVLSPSLPGEPIEVYGDKDRLRQVMVNLIDNAVKYTEPGGRVTVTATDGPDRVEITVADTGIGIAPQHLPRIFERFYRIDKDRSREAGGTGLGLSIVKHIIEAHRSSITVQSEIGTGSRFTFSLRKREGLPEQNAR